ncbi:site-specific integrase [Spirosoma taeanense]|uniref:Site-specific integrase n=1 Tax=Spirosoma taeanense TaxID=2735870 RepID=A0A6M5Y8Y6_9BACT|nr:site-specific integrase [Spirosoma taeanense]QJW90748.1 site-specific integrase [Spirosoma taeanense]
MARTTEHKEGKATVRIIYRTAKTLSDGSHPFWVRITKDRKTKFVATGLSLAPKYWNDKYTGFKEAIRKSYPEPYREELIKKLTSWENKYADTAEALASADEKHDARTVASKTIEGRKRTRDATLLAYIDELVTAMIAARQKGNSIIYRDLKNQLADFLHKLHGPQKKDVPFSQVTVRFCNQLETFLRQRGNSDTTLSNRYRTLRAVFNKAIAEGLAKPDHYPFARNISEKHKFSIGKFDTSTQKRAISRDDIRKIEAFIPIGTATGKSANLRNAIEVERLTLAKSVFLFSFYCGGINFVDLAKLRWHNLSVDNESNHRLTYIRQKTGGKFSIRLLSPAVAIIEQYRSYTYTSPDNYVFPILNTQKHQTATQVHNRTHKVSAMINADLKILGERVGISTPLTTYVARHSFATTLRQKGTATAVISQALGHKTEAVTAIYLDSFASETVDSAYDALL